ncbi:STAS domain-containing protein [Streptacidiphilus carbonis]|uniref:STAS domain-containing protein n=1 Tax=Streptacidiphilus carbonis TaxID=105422 RepID=UPI0005A6BE64|nr:STAS domain-containing protein [Streptacidiphilus carbonis]
MVALRIDPIEGGLLVGLPPEFDSVHIGQLTAPLREQVLNRDPRPGRVVLDLSPVQFIDTPGLALISRARRLGADLGIEVLVVAPTPAQRRLLGAMGLDPGAVHATVPAALAGSRPDGRRPDGRRADGRPDGRPDGRGPGPGSGTLLGGFRHSRGDRG